MAGDMPGIKNIIRRLRSDLPPRTFRHSLRTAQTAETIARKYGIDAREAFLSGLLHDCAKDSSGHCKTLIKGVRLSAEDRKIPAIWHNAAGKVLARQRYGIRSRAVLSAIAKHSTGSDKMSALDKAVYIADYIEPGRKFRSSRKILSMFRKGAGLDELALSVAMEKTGYLKMREMKIHGNTMAMIKSLKRRLK